MPHTPSHVFGQPSSPVSSVHPTRSRHERRERAKFKQFRILSRDARARRPESRSRVDARANWPLLNRYMRSWKDKRNPPRSEAISRSIYRARVLGRRLQRRGYRWRWRWRLEARMYNARRCSYSSVARAFARGHRLGYTTLGYTTTTRADKVALDREDSGNAFECSALLL